MLCHFRISVAGSPPQTVVFQLHPDKCPRTCDNFIALCQSSAIAKRPPSSALSAAVASSRTHDVQPTYRGTEFHRILPGFMIQGGDFTKFDGTGGHAAPTTNNGQLTFSDENFDTSHDREGVLSMANKGKNTNGSQFFITLGKALHLDRKHVAFGHVVRGMEVVREASKVETEGNNGRPVMLQRVVIADCGVGTGDADVDDGSDFSSSSSLSESSSSDDRRRKRSGSKKKEKRHKKRKRSRDDNDRSSRSFSRPKHRKRHHRDVSSRDRKHGEKSKGISSERHRNNNFSSEEDERQNGRHHSSKKRRKRDRRSDDRGYRKR